MQSPPIKYDINVSFSPVASYEEEREELKKGIGQSEHLMDDITENVYVES